MGFVNIRPITSMKGAFSVEGLNVVVTGGNRGLGCGIAQAFAECGANVAVLCRNGESGRRTAEELSLHGTDCLAVMCDVSRYDDVRAARETVAARFEHVDVLVNNAGVDAKKSLFIDDRLEEFRSVIDVNLVGAAAMSKVFGQWMMDSRRGGSVINISSIGGQAIGDARSHPMPSYNASKAALDHLTRHLCPIMGDYGIRVNAIAPGPTHSDLDADLPENAQRAIDESMPMHRFGEPLEIGALAVFLASPAASHITGTVINHDGGMLVVGLTF